MLLTKEHAQALRLPAKVWRESSGGYDGCRYRAEELTATHSTEDAMFFLGGSGRTWRSYNRKYLGWRLWIEEPTAEEQLAAEWESQ